MSDGRERGEIAMRLVIGVMAAIAGLAWVVPVVFLGRQHVEHAADLTGASSRQGEARTTAPTDPIGRATDVSAQASLSTAMTAAQTYHAQTGTYEGFDERASTFDPSIHVASGAARPGEISVRGVTETTIVLVSQDQRGAMLCAAADGGTVTYGRTDAQTPLQCSGGW